MGYDGSNLYRSPSAMCMCSSDTKAVSSEVTQKLEPLHLLCSSAQATWGLQPLEISLKKYEGIFTSFPTMISKEEYNKPTEIISNSALASVPYSM
jgi:hypothetical protein